MQVKIVSITHGKVRLGRAHSTGFPQIVESTRTRKSLVTRGAYTIYATSMEYRFFCLVVCPSTIVLPIQADNIWCMTSLGHVEINAAARAILRQDGIRP
jgi:hypothetical protein